MKIASTHAAGLDSTPAINRAEGPRVLLYSHDSVGLGHLRRNLVLASTLVERIPGASALVVTGSPCATQFPVPPGVDLVKLPSVTKDSKGEYTPRTLPQDRGFVVNLRRRILLETFRAFAPDLVLVDHQVVGLMGEATDLLVEARKSGVRTALGLRDVIDDPTVVVNDLQRPSVRWALTECYDHVFVYGDPRVFDPRTEYGLPEDVAERLEFTGYVVRDVPRWSECPVPSLRPSVLLTVGGGQDGAERVELYLEALEQGAAEGQVEWDSTIVLGPLLDDRRARSIKRRARGLDGVTVHRFHADLPALFADSDLVVSMAGYNTTAEILRSGAPSVLLPRAWPRREQEIRASRLAELGLTRALTRPTPESLLEAVREGLADGPIDTSALPLDGQVRLANRLSALLTRPHSVRAVAL
jgi:predicted glycosyltransferase